MRKLHFERELKLVAEAEGKPETAMGEGVKNPKTPTTDEILAGKEPVFARPKLRIVR